jgi:hypothetical protein
MKEFWDWLRINKDPMLALAPFCAALAGFGGVMLAQRFIVKARREEALGDWWETYAVTDGIEPIINYLNAYAFQDISDAKLSEIKAPLPHSEIARFAHLVGSTTHIYCNEINRFLTKGDYEKFNSMTTEIFNVISSLIEIQAILLDIKIQKKGDINTIHDNALIIKSRKKLNQIIQRGIYNTYGDSKEELSIYPYY